MLKRLIKLTIVVLMFALFVSSSISFAKIDDEEYETVVLNGENVTYMYTTQLVKMPVTYNGLSNEMRGAWVQTVWNGDMKKQNGTTEADINAWKEQYLSVLDTLEKYNMNTVFFQVRPCNDAFYESEYNDWSKFMFKEGVNPGWDPLTWMVEETHKRNMQFQCWMNAFRVTESEQFEDNAFNHTDQELIDAKARAIAQLTTNNFAKKHPECVLLGDYDSKLILNPADLLVHEHLLNTIEELITKYDIDGFHFDDYFYLSGRSQDQYDPQKYNVNFAGGVEYKAKFTGSNMMNDLPTYQDYLNDPDKYDLEASLELCEFRRSSLNNLFKKIRQLVDNLNLTLGRHVEFGSKPAAVWQSNSEKCHDSKSTSPLGSNTHCGAYNSNYNLFADTKYWVEHGYVDWIAPQVYFDFQSNEVPYADIVKWWANIVTKTNEARALENLKPIKMYVAHGIYKYADSSTEYTDSNESVYQLRYNNNFDCIVGDAYYAFSDLKVFQNDVQKRAINTNLYLFYRNHPALPITLDPLDNDEIMMVSVQVKQSTQVNHVNLVFDQVEGASMYIIHRVPKGEAIDYTDTKYRINIVKGCKYEDEISVDIFINDTFDFYVQAVSDNYYPSKHLMKVDTDNIIVNHAPQMGEITFDKADLTYNDLLKVHIPYATDEDNDQLTYTFKLTLDGFEGFELQNIQYLENEITAEFQGFGSEVEEVLITVTVSDGINTIEIQSPVASFAKPSTTPVTPVNPPVQEPEKESGGCGFGASVIISFFALVATSFILFKRR